MPLHHSFQESFWSPTSSLDAIPNFTIGFQVLHSKLKQSSSENDIIIEHIQQRIAAEKAHAATLGNLLPPTTSNPFDDDIGAGLRRCFEVVCAESVESSKEHTLRAENLHTTTLDPLVHFNLRYNRILSTTQHSVQTQILRFETLCKAMGKARTYYHGKCKALLAVQPGYNGTPSLATQGRIYVAYGLEFDCKTQAWSDWLQGLSRDHGGGEDVFLTKEAILTWLKKNITTVTMEKTDKENVLVVDDDYVNLIFSSLLRLEFLRDNQDRTFALIDPTAHSYVNTSNNNTETKTNSLNSDSKKISTSFLGRWGTSATTIMGNSHLPQQNSKLEVEMLEADKTYHTLVQKVENLRLQTEQILYNHYEEMASLELERIQTIKQVFISMAALLSNTIPRCKETFDNMMLYQETLKPEKDVQFIVEQYRTGQFCPRPVLYENYFEQVNKNQQQLFGVPLDEITKAQAALVPPFMTVGLSVIESGFSRLYDEEKNVVWSASVPLDRVHAARQEINGKIISRKTLERFDLLLLASLVRLYLLELPECLFTFELYEPCKLLYMNQEQDKDNNSRLVSISKLLTTLPACNYHTITTLLEHFHTLFKQLSNSNNTAFAKSVSKSFSYILLRPQVESKLSAHERHSQRLIQDCIEHFDIIFSQESKKFQEAHSNRTAIVVASRPLPPSSAIPEKKSSMDSIETSSITSNSTRRSSSILSSFRLHKSQQQLTSNSSMKSPGMVIMPSAASKLFEDPDEIIPSSNSRNISNSISSTSSSSILSTPPLTSYNNNSARYSLSNERDQFVLDELTSLDSFFEDEDN